MTISSSNSGNGHIFYTVKRYKNRDYLLRLVTKQCPQTQADFSGGINTRVAPHEIAPNQVAEIKNADLSFGDVRGEYGLSDGGQVGFYEAASAWISGEGLSGDTQMRHSHLTVVAFGLDLVMTQWLLQIEILLAAQTQKLKIIKH